VLLNEIVFLIFPLLPGLLGMTFGAMLASAFQAGNEGLRILSAGCGGFIAYLFLSGLIYAGNVAGIQVFRLVYLHSLAWLSIFLLAILLWNLRHRVEVRIGVYSLAAVPVLVLLGLNLYAVSVMPVAGWDSLGLWTGWAEDYLIFDSARTNSEIFDRSHHRHPITVISLAAFSGYAASQGVTQLGALVAWWFVWVCGALVVAGAVFSVSRNYWLACLVAYAYCSVPLLENHATLAGYADLWVAVSAISASGLIAVGLAGAPPFIRSYSGILLKYLGHILVANGLAGLARSIHTKSGQSV